MMRSAIFALVVAAAALPTPALAGDVGTPPEVEIGGPCRDKDYVIIVMNPVSGDRVKVCFDSPEPDPAG